MESNLYPTWPQVYVRTGMFMRMSTTIDMKYIPMIWEKNSTMMLELLELEIQMKNLDIVNNKPKENI